MNPPRHPTRGITRLEGSGRIFLRIVVVAAAVSLSLVGLAMAQGAAASIKKSIDIAPQELCTALQVFSKASGLHLVYVSEDVSSLHTHGATGDLTPDEALRQILGGTGLTYRYLDDSTITIIPGSAGPTRQGSGPGEETTKDNRNHEGAQKKPFWDGFRLVQSDQGHTPGNAAVKEPVDGKAARAQPPLLEEVIVTAAKLRQPARTVAGSVVVRNNSITH
jgi:iron complex outermembrane recepter protein